MGLFEQFPYTNLHDINLDWLLRKVKSLTGEVEKLEKLIDGLADLDPEQIQELIAAIEGLEDNSPRTINGNVILNMQAPTGYSLNGGCYIGGGRVVVYYAHDQGAGADDIGDLVCYDLTNYAQLWSYPIKGYHGNSITYYYGKLYIAACLATGSSALMDTVVVVDLSDPSTVEQEIHPAVTGEGLYSLVYYDGLFYAITNRGTTPSVANLVNIFDTDFNYIGNKYLPAYNIGSNQGLQTAADGKLFSLGYEDPRVYAYDLDGAHDPLNAPLARVFSGYKFVGEPEFLTYDWDNKCFIMGGMNSNGGAVGIRYPYMAEIGIFEDVREKIITGSGINRRSGLGTALFKVRFDSFSLQPATSNGTFYNLLDAVTAAKLHDGDSVISIYQGSEQLDFTIEGYEGVLMGHDSGSPVSWDYLKIADCRLVLANSDFPVEGEYYYHDDGAAWDCNLFIGDSSVVIHDCSFTAGANYQIGGVASRIHIGKNIAALDAYLTDCLVTDPAQSVTLAGGSGDLVLPQDVIVTP